MMDIKEINAWRDKHGNTILERYYTRPNKLKGFGVKDDVTVKLKLDMDSARFLATILKVSRMDHDFDDFDDSIIGDAMNEICKAMRKVSDAKDEEDEMIEKAIEIIEAGPSVS